MCYNGVNMNYRGEKMELGEKILQARQALGMSQRQLCGDTITRNMLSQIEHGTAKPSMGTLQILAARLGKPVGYFLDEDGVLTPNQPRIEQAREAYDGAEYAQVLEILEDYQGPDRIFDREYALLLTLSRLAMAEAAIHQGKHIYARELLSQIDAIPYGMGEIIRRKSLLEAQLTGKCDGLPDLDEELLLRAKDALRRGFFSRSLHLLEAMENHTGPKWNLLRGDICMKQRDYASAARYYHRAEEAYPAETAGKLEQCYRELEDFKKAYFYACKQKK